MPLAAVRIVARVPFRFIGAVGLVAKGIAPVLVD